MTPRRLSAILCSELAEYLAAEDSAVVVGGRRLRPLVPQDYGDAGVGMATNGSGIGEPWTRRKAGQRQRAEAARWDVDYPEGGASDVAGFCGGSPYDY